MVVIMRVITISYDIMKWSLCLIIYLDRSLLGHKTGLYTRGRPNFRHGFGYGAKTASKMTFCPISVSTNLVSAKFPLRP